MTTDSDAAWVQGQFGASMLAGDPWADGDVAYEFLPDEAGRLWRPIDAETAGKIAALLTGWHPHVVTSGEHYRVVIPRPSL
jgi:hypothetical protein